LVEVFTVGLRVIVTVGFADGLRLGLRVGETETVGFFEGFPVGLRVGETAFTEGDTVGFFEGFPVGLRVVDTVGVFEGETVDLAVGKPPGVRHFPELASGCTHLFEVQEAPGSQQLDRALQAAKLETQLDVL